MLVKFWDPRSGKDISTLHSHKAVVNACNWNPNGHLVATAGGDGLIRLFDIRTFRELEPMKGHTKEVNCGCLMGVELTTGLEWHPIHPSILASGDAAGAIIYWSLLAPNHAEPVTVLEAAHEDAVFTLSFHPLGHILCSGSKDFTARFWCRARPMGGQEVDRWHIGEEKAMGAKMEEEREKTVRAKVDDVVPGLPGLSQPYSTPAVPMGLPGLGGPPPPTRSWGDPMTAGRGPLPSQDEMLRKGHGQGYGQRYPSQGYGRR